MVACLLGKQRDVVRRKKTLLWLALSHFVARRGSPSELSLANSVGFIAIVCIWLMGWNLGSPDLTASATTGNRTPCVRERESGRRASTNTPRLYPYFGVPWTLSRLDKHSASTARTHVQRVRLQMSTACGINSLPLEARKGQRPQTRPKHTFMTPQGGPRIYNDCLNEPLFVPSLQ